MTGIDPNGKIPLGHLIGGGDQHLNGADGAGDQKEIDGIGNDIDDHDQNNGHPNRCQKSMGQEAKASQKGIENNRQKAGAEDDQKYEKADQIAKAIRLTHSFSPPYTQGREW